MDKLHSTVQSLNILLRLKCSLGDAVVAKGIVCGKM